MAAGIVKEINSTNRLKSRQMCKMQRLNMMKLCRFP